MWLFKETNTFEPSKDWECGTESQRSALFLFIKYHSVYCQLYVINFHGIHAFSLSHSSASVISYGCNLGDFVKDFYELSMILISYELELNPGIKLDPEDQRKC